MPAHNVTIDDVSALIQYTPLGDAWKDSPTSDSGLGSYWDSTYHSTNQYGASATFQFDGIAVYLYAAKRFQHGPYIIYLDGKQMYNGTFQSNASIYKQIMFSATGLTPGTHNLTCTNNDPTNTTYTEVDYITWTTSMDSSLNESEDTSIDVSNMSYSSMAAWSKNIDSEPTMTTATDGASVTINFQGNGIELNGKTGPYGAFSAQVDNNPPRQLNAQSAQTHSTLLFRQDNLSSGNHTLVVTNRGGGFTSLAIGKATPIIWSTDPNPSSGSNVASHSSHAGAIAGGVVGGVVGLAALLLLLLWFIRRRRRAQRGEQEGDAVQPSQEPAFIDATPFVLPPPTTSSRRESKLTAGDDYTQSGMSMYQGVPRSAGLSSRGSFDYGPGHAGAAGSSSAGTTAGGAGWQRPSKEMRHSGPTMRHEPEFDEASMRDRDAGPVLLPQLPPAYSSASGPGPAPLDSGPSPVPISPTPIPESTEVGQHHTPVPTPSPRPT